MQRFLFGEFGSLVVPWHVDVIRSIPWLPITGVIMVTGLAIKFCMTAGASNRTRLAMMSLAWVIVGATPLASFFFVAPDLQGSRYLYLPTMGWAAVLMVMAEDECNEHDDMRTAVSTMGVCAMVVLIALGAMGTSFHIRQWERAAALRDQVELAARTDQRIRACRDIRLVGLPDAAEGAYVFRNGATEAFARDLGLRAIVDTDTGECSFKWNPQMRAFTQIGK
jgi:hypothetical protein